MDTLTNKSQELHILLLECYEILKCYADDNSYWEYSDGGKCHIMKNADQGEKAKKMIAKLGKLL